MSTFNIDTEVGTVYVTETFGLGGQVLFNIAYPDGSQAMLVGSASGTPGPVTLLIEGWSGRLNVPKPGRYGDQFNDEWVTRFITNEEVS